MESDKNPFPQIDLFPRITKAANFIKGILRFDEDLPNTGAAPMLDRELYDNPNQLRLFDGE